MRYINLKNKFTLIELLTVISIIAILVTILLPVLSKAKGKAQEITCTGNMKQSGLSMQMYAGDHNNSVFMFSSYVPEMGWSETLYNGDYLKNRNTALCSAWAPKKYDTTMRWATYGIEYEIDLPEYPVIWGDVAKKSRFRNLTKCGSPSLRVSLADSMWGPGSTHFLYQGWVVQINPNTSTTGVHLRHSRQANTLFWDLHVRKSGIKDWKNQGFYRVFDLNGNTIVL